jgi:hypothetical protein
MTREMKDFIQKKERMKQEVEFIRKSESQYKQKLTDLEQTFSEQQGICNQFKQDLIQKNKMLN